MKNPHAAALGKLGGSKKSPAKAKSARENGRKGGRPRNKAVVPKGSWIDHKGISATGSAKIKAAK